MKEPSTAAAAAAVATVNVGQDDASELQAASELQDTSEPTPGLQEADVPTGLTQASDELPPVEPDLAELPSELASSVAPPDPDCDRGDDGKSAEEPGGWAVSAMREAAIQGEEEAAHDSTGREPLDEAEGDSTGRDPPDEAAAADHLEGEVAAGDRSEEGAAPNVLQGEAPMGDSYSEVEAASDERQGSDESAPPSDGDGSGREGGGEGVEGGALPSQDGEGLASSPTRPASYLDDTTTPVTSSSVTAAAILTADVTVDTNDGPEAITHVNLTPNDSPLIVVAPSENAPSAVVIPDPPPPSPTTSSLAPATLGDVGLIPPSQLPQAGCLPTVRIPAGSSAALDPTESTTPQPDPNRTPTGSTDPEPAGVQLDPLLQPAKEGARDEDVPVSVGGGGGRGEDSCTAPAPAMHEKT